MITDSNQACFVKMAGRGLQEVLFEVVLKQKGRAIPCFDSSAIEGRSEEGK